MSCGSSILAMIARLPATALCPTCDDDACNLRIAHINRLTLALPSGSKLGGRLCCRLIEIKYAPFQVLNHEAGEGGFKGLSTPAFGQQCEPQPGLDDGNAGNPDRLGCLTIQPFDDWPVRNLSHQRRKHVGVDHDHGSRSAGRASWPRSSGRSALNPVAPKRAEIRDPIPAIGRPESLVALRRICRISSSMLRPWRSARRFSLTFTSSSIFRTTT